MHEAVVGKLTSSWLDWQSPMAGLICVVTPERALASCMHLVVSGNMCMRVTLKLHIHTARSRYSQNYLVLVVL